MWLRVILYSCTASSDYSSKMAFLLPLWKPDSRWIKTGRIWKKPNMNQHIRPIFCHSCGLSTGKDRAIPARASLFPAGAIITAALLCGQTPCWGWSIVDQWDKVVGAGMQHCVLCPGFAAWLCRFCMPTGDSKSEVILATESVQLQVHILCRPLWAVNSHSTEPGSSQKQWKQAWQWSEMDLWTEAW